MQWFVEIIDYTWYWPTSSWRSLWWCQVSKIKQKHSNLNCVKSKQKHKDDEQAFNQIKEYYEKGQDQVEEGKEGTTAKVCSFWRYAWTMSKREWRDERFPDKTRLSIFMLLCQRLWRKCHPKAHEGMHVYQSDAQRWRQRLVRTHLDQGAWGSQESKVFQG